MRSVISKLSLAAMLASAPLSSLGQQPPDQFAPVQERGFGGPGMGPPMGGPMMGGPMMMMAGSGIGILEMAEVLKELDIREDQKKAVQDALQSNQEKIRTMMDSFDPAEMFSLAPEERQAKMAEMARKFQSMSEETLSSLEGKLDESQTKRIRELILQREGLRAFERDEISDQLKLTDDQKSELGEAIAKSNPMRGGPGFGGPGFGGPGPGGPGFGGPPDFNAIQQQADKARDEFLAQLTDEQRGKWERIKGEEFRFPPPMNNFGPPGMGPEIKLVKKFDKNDDGWLNAEERVAARVEAKSSGGGMMGGRGGRRGGGGGQGGFPGGPAGPGGFPGGPGGPGGFPGGPGGPGGFPGGPSGPGGGQREPFKPGIQISKDEVKHYGDESLYDTTVLRTVFIDFENDGWESEMADFKPTDVEVNATMTVDGKVYPNVGVGFRGSSSYFMIGEGYKRSLNVAMDMADKDQRLLNTKSLNFLNSNDDASMMHAVLYSHIASQYLPTPKANFVRVVINGENWGIYQNVEQFNKDFVAANFPSGDGARWKVPGRPGGGGSLAYLGDNMEEYKRLYEIKSKDREEDWQGLVELCKVLNETPADQLEKALEPIMDIDSALWFLAIDNVLINSDGYWIRASDYNMYRDPDGKFHILPHDMNESFQPAMGPGAGGPGGMGGPGGGMGGPGGGMGRRGGRPGERGRPGEGGRPQGQPPRNRNGNVAGNSQVGVDPLVGLDDTAKPLRSKLLAVPSLRKRYLEKVRTLAREALDWEKLGPVVAKHAALIQDDVQKDTRKLSNFAAFQQAVSESVESAGGGRGRMSLKNFAVERQKFLLEHPAIKSLDD